MKNNSIVTYDEIVDAIKSIIECSINNDYENDFDYLNVKYESETENKIDSKNESLLYYSLKELEKNIDEASNIIRQALVEQLDDNLDKIIIDSDYILGYENRKLSASLDSINKLKRESLNIDIIKNIPTEKTTALDMLIEEDTNKILSDFEKKAIEKYPEYFDSDIPNEELNYEDEIDYEKIEMINKALRKAKQIGDIDLINKLQNMLDEEIK